MTDKELIRRALLGSREAQQECTEKGIVLPCPFCGNEYPAITNVQGYGIEIKCQHCNITSGRDFYGYGRAKERCRSVTLRAWNTRPAPPVGRCKDCVFSRGLTKDDQKEYRDVIIEYKDVCMCAFLELPELRWEDDFCSYFKKREG